MSYFFKHLNNMSEKVTSPGKGAKQTEKILFERIWMRSGKRSEISGLHLRQYRGKDMWYSCFAHILAKGQNKYHHFKFLAANIMLMDPHEHHLYDHGTEEQRISYALDLEQKTKGRGTADWQKLKDRKEELEKLYEKHFPSTFSGILNYKYSPDEVFKVVGELNRIYFEALDET